jgi:MoaA/NifB/PqqE/SkfB family radical SAM enzyme
LTEEKSRELIQSGLDYLIVSCDGASEHTYNLYHRKNYFHQVIKNLRELIKLKKELKSLTPLVELQFIVMKENEKEIAKIRSLAEELKVDKLTYLKLDTTNINFDKFEGIDSKEDILPKNKDYCLDMQIINQIDFCKVPWEETLVRYSGVILPCCVDLSQAYEMGRVFKEGYYLGFKTIWHNSRYCNFRRKISRGINFVKICQHCAKKDNTDNNEIKGA